MRDAALGSGERPRHGSRRWSRRFWILEVAAIAVIVVVVLMLQYSEEGYMRQNGLRVAATVDELSPGKDSCRRCPLSFTIGEEQHHVVETLIAGDTEDEDRRYFPGDSIELYVDPDDMSHTIEVGAVNDNIRLGLSVMAIAAVFALSWLAYEFRRSIQRPVRS